MILPSLLILSFLTGCIPTGLLVVRFAGGVDIRQIGSGNIGATNVVRSVGWTWGIFTLVLDAAKAAAILLAFTYVDTPLETDLVRWQIGAGLLVMSGNIFNPFLKFRGGKGVGAGVGITAVIAPLPLVWAVAAFVAGYGLSRVVSVGSIAAGIAIAVVGAVQYRSRPELYSPEWLGFCLLIGVVVLVTHRSNIKRLLQGTETRLTNPK